MGFPIFPWRPFPGINVTGHLSCSNTCIRGADGAGVFTRQLINTLATVPPAGFEILAAGNEEPGLWIFAAYATAGL